MVISLYMGWRHVLFANWPVSPRVLAPALPDAVTLDTYDGNAWLSVVPFTNVDVRPRILPFDIGLPLPELNLRTYVTYDGTPGVYFFSLDAEGLLAVLGARFFHYLPYYYAKIDLLEEGDEFRFTSRRHHPGARPVHFDAAYRPVGRPVRAESGTLPYFLTERYRYYTEAPTGAVRHAEIQHDPWPLYDAEVTIERNTLFRANGFDTPDSEPVHFYSPGVDTIASESKRSS
ncbi:DUF2071 domain-containing protein [Halomontanus rarus]|uniref:DUF2071 domain-containing protein n=1 Tax=Halomontanus rarus TaxID=3034020 RepID=UPI001A9933AF